MIIPIAKRTHHGYKNSIIIDEKHFVTRETSFIPQKSENDSMRDLTLLYERLFSKRGSLSFNFFSTGTKKMAKAKCQWQQQPQQRSTKEQESFFKFIAADRLATSWLEGKWNNWNLNESCKVTLHGEKKISCARDPNVVGKISKKLFHCSELGCN